MNLSKARERKTDGDYRIEERDARAKKKIEKNYDALIKRRSALRRK